MEEEESRHPGPRPTGREDEDVRTTYDVTREELRTTFEYQVQRLREIDGKAIEILKANLLLIGILVTGGSILVQTDLDIGLFLNPFTIFGAVLLLASTGLAAVTYTASNLRGGLDADAVEAAIAAETGAELSADEFEQRLLRSYARWIEYNARVTAINDMLATVTVLLVFVAFLYVMSGVAVGALVTSQMLLWLLFSGMTVASIGFLSLVYHMDHLGHQEPQPGTFPGVRLSKGATRSQGRSDLRAMLGRAPPEDLDETEAE